MVVEQGETMDTEKILIEVWEKKKERVEKKWSERRKDRREREAGRKKGSEGCKKKVRKRSVFNEGDIEIKVKRRLKI